MSEKKVIRPLKVALVPGTEDLEKVKKELIEKGHEVKIVEELSQYDLVLGDTAHRLGKFNEKLLPIVIKAVRQRVYGTKGSAKLD